MREVHFFRDLGVHDDGLAGKHANGHDFRHPAFSRGKAEQVERHDHSSEEKIAESGIQPFLGDHAGHRHRSENSSQNNWNEHVIFHRIASV